MANSAASRAAHPLASEQSPVFIRAATLISRDAEALARFYISTLGFERISANASAIDLGAGSVAFLRIENRPEAKPFQAGSSGLFHIAYLLPSRADLARWFLAVRAAGAPFEGASDHGVSEAFYLTDPEGNGIEIYVDRPRETWPRDAVGYAMTTGPMALRDLAASVDATTINTPHLPEGTRIGHIHLQTGNAERDALFWQQTFGLVETHRRPGARFLSWGGYHHHIALNNWRSTGAGPRNPDSAGLAAIEFAVQGAETFADLTQRSGAPAAHEALHIRDPNGLSLTFRDVESP